MDYVGTVVRRLWFLETHHYIAPSTGLSHSLIVTMNIIIPGVSSITACAAKAGVNLAIGGESIVILVVMIPRG